jgi:hypothetical protein
VFGAVEVSERGKKGTYTSQRKTEWSITLNILLSTEAGERAKCMYASVRGACALQGS